MFRDDELDALVFSRNRIYTHKVLRVNFTTYDMRHQQDSINPRTYPNIIVHAADNDRDNGHPYFQPLPWAGYHTEL